MIYYTSIQHSDVISEDSNKKPTKFKMQTGYPFSDLDDRDFERFLYLLYHTEISKGTGDRFDEVRLMQGVGERGRDCTLYLNQECVGVIQCKQLSSNLDRPTLGKEIIKFSLNSILDQSLRGTATEFRYIVAVARGFSEPATKLRDEWNTKSFDDSELEEWSKIIIKKYSGLKTLSWEGNRSELKNALKAMKVEFILPENLTLRLNNCQDLINTFFAVDNVVDIKLLEDLLESRDCQAFKFKTSLTDIERELKEKNPELFRALEEVKQRYRTEVEDRKPDFSKLTNHKRDHSCELRRILDILYVKVTPSFTDRELYVLATSAVLHDVAALYPQEDIDKITEGDEANKHQRRYPQRHTLAHFAERHAKFGGDLLRNLGVERFAIKVEYLESIALVASARSVEEMTESSGYGTSCHTKGSGYEIRVYLLAILLRIAELLDFKNISSNVLVQGQESLPGFARSCNIWNDWNDFDRPLAQVNFPTNADPVLIGNCDDQNIFLGIRRRVQYVSDQIRLARKQLSKRSIPATCLAITDFHDDIKSKFANISPGFHLDENRVFESLIGDALYDTPLAGIRELLQNAVDACRQRKMLYENYEPKIQVTLCNDSLSVSDNGVGMDTFVIDNFFSRLASTSHQTEDIEGFTAIGRFGIGVFSYFLLCDSFAVNTKPLNGKPTRFSANRVLSCPFFYFNEGHLPESGTTVTMFIRQDRINLLTQKAVSEYIAKTFRYVSIPIEVQIDEFSFVVEPCTPVISYEEHFRPFFKIEYISDAEQMDLLLAKVDSDFLTGQVGITIPNEFNGFSGTHQITKFKPNQLGIDVWELGIYIGKITSKLIPTLVGEINLSHKTELKLSRDGFANQAEDKIIRYCEIALIKRYTDKFNQLDEGSQYFLSEFLISSVMQIVKLTSDESKILKNKICVLVITKNTSITTSLDKWPNILEKSKCVLIISDHVAGGQPLNETKQMLLLERYNCPLVLGNMYRGDTFLILSAVVNKFSISIVTTEDASHIMLSKDYCETHELPTYNLFVSFDSDDFCTSSFALHTVFFNKDHTINKMYLECVGKQGTSNVNDLFVDLFQKMNEMIKMITMQNNQETYSRKYINLTNINLYLKQINQLCGCELTLTANDFPEWLRSSVG